MQTLQTFFNMGGYAYYVWASYSSVILFLSWQAFKSWHQLRKQATSHE